MNKQLLTIKKVGEERYFRNWIEFWHWYDRQAYSNDSLKAIDNSPLPANKKDKYLPIKNGDNFEVYGDKALGHIGFVYKLMIGSFRGGKYKINVLAVERK
jgi:hypothetical protein